MTVKVGINGFGRIGRGVLRALLERHDDQVEIVAVNDLIPTAQNAHYLKYDSVHGRFPFEVSASENSIKAGNQTMNFVAERDPGNIKWSDYGVDIVLECTGLFTAREKAELHFLSLIHI